MRHPAAVRVVWVLTCLLLVACGASQRTKTLQASIHAVNAARDGFVAYDRAQEHKLVEQANTREEAEASVAAYRVKSGPVWTAFELVYRALAVAATQTDDPSLKAALAQIPELLAAINMLTSGGP